MHHLDKLSRQRQLRLYMLTPDDVVPPLTKTFVVSLRQFTSSALSSSVDEHGRITLRNSEASRRLGPREDQQKEWARDEPLFEAKRKHMKETRAPVRMLYKEGCPICGRNHKDVLHFGHRHICAACRAFVKTPDGRKVRIQLERDSISVQAKRDTRPGEDPADPLNLVIFERPCYCVLAAPKEIAVLLYEEGWTI
jgi:regulator of replication initiation timing